MQHSRRFVAWAVGITVVTAAAAAAILPRAVSSSANDVREIRLEVRDVTYYVEGQQEPNPTLHVQRGEHVRILLRNTDAGMSHDIVLRALRVGTGLVRGGEEAAVELVAPAAPGEQTYACTPHGETMHGTIRIE